MTSVAARLRAQGDLGGCADASGRSYDGTAFAGGAFLLTAVASLAADLPARRAANTAPAEMLRAE